MNKDTITINRKVFLNLCAAAEQARAYMALNNPASKWSNEVRQSLHNALADAIAEKPENKALAAAKA